MKDGFPGPSRQVLVGLLPWMLLSQGTAGERVTMAWGCWPRGPCLPILPGRHKDKQLLWACLCICKYRHTRSELWEQSGHLPPIQCMSQLYSQGHRWRWGKQRASLPLSQACRQAQSWISEPLRFSHHTITINREHNSNEMLSYCSIVLSRAGKCQVLLTRQGWKCPDNRTSRYPFPVSSKAVL